MTDPAGNSEFCLLLGLNVEGLGETKLTVSLEASHLITHAHSYCVVHRVTFSLPFSLPPWLVQPSSTLCRRNLKTEVKLCMNASNVFRPHHTGENLQAQTSLAILDLRFRKARAAVSTISFPEPTYLVVSTKTRSSGTINMLVPRALVSFAFKI